MQFYTDTAVKFLGFFTEPYYNELIARNTLEKWYAACLIVHQIDGYSLKQAELDLGINKEPQYYLGLVERAKKEIAEGEGISLEALFKRGLIPVWSIEWQYSHSYFYKVKNVAGVTLASFEDENLLPVMLGAVSLQSLTVETLDENGSLIDRMSLSEYFD